MAGKANIWVGTSGFQYPEWKGSFYPEKISAPKMLPYYAERFSTTEINYTFNRIPTVKALANWAAATPDRFRFSLKALKLITHIKKLQGAETVLNEFWAAAQELQGKLGVILFQLPPWLKKDATLLTDFLATLPPGLKAAFEFRHASWFDDEIFNALRARNTALCIADSEKLSAPPVATADFGYFRLRDEGYARTDISRWAKVIAAQAKTATDVYVYFKHEETGTGPEFARTLLKALG